MRKLGIILLCLMTAVLLLLYARCYWTGPSAPLLREYGFVLRGITLSGTLYRTRLDSVESASLRRKVEAAGWDSIASCDSLFLPITTDFDFHAEKGDYYAWKHFDRAELTCHLIIRRDGTVLFHQFDTN